MTDKTLSERVVEVLARCKRSMGSVLLERDMAQIICEQQAEIDRLTALLHEAASRAGSALDQCDRLRAENEALRAAFRRVCRVYCVDDQHPDPSAATDRAVAYHLNEARSQP